MKISTFMTVATVAVPAVATLLSVLTTSASALELRYNRWLPPTHHVDVRVMKPYFDKISEVTEGRVNISFTNSSLGGIERQYEMTAMGIVDVAFLSESLTPGQFPLAGIVEMPGLGEDNEAVSVAYWRTYKAFFEASNPYKEVKILGLASLPPYHIYNSARPITKGEDMHGLKLRASGVLPSEKIRALGATVVPAQITQFLEMISKGVIDGAYYNDDGIYSFGFLDNLKYKTQFEGGLGGMSVAVAMNKAKWDQISPEDQAAIDAISGEELAKAIGVSYNQSIAEVQEAIEASGMEITIADETFMASVFEKLAPIQEKWIESAKAVGVDGGAALENLRTEATNYSN